MRREQIAKMAVATGVFAIVVVAVSSCWFLLPSMKGGSQAIAQAPTAGGGMPGAPGGGMPGAPGGGGMPGMPGAPGGGGMPGAPSAGGMPGAPGGGGMMGAPGGGGMMGGAAPSAAGLGIGAPLEPSRANPFASFNDASKSVTKFVSKRTKYGQDWSQIPIGYTTSIPQPRIPAGQPVAIPPNPRSIASLIRISSVIWPATDSGVGSSGRAYITYEDADGKTRLASPGSSLRVTDPQTKETQQWQVQAIRPDAVILRNMRSGEETTMRTQARSSSENRYFGAQSMSKQIDNQPTPGRSTQLPGMSSTGSTNTGMGAGPGMMGPGMMGSGMMGPAN